MNHLFQRLLAKFNNPRFRNDPVFVGGIRAWEWYEPRQLNGEPFAGFGLEVPAEDSRAMRRGDLLVAVWGVNEIRLSWPNLDFWCGVYRDGEGGKAEKYLGRIELFFEPDDEEEVNWRSTRDLNTASG